MCFPVFSGFMGGGLWIFPLFGLIIMTLFLLLLFRLLTGRDRWGGPFCGTAYGGEGAASPADIARRRYARGEIGKEELDDILAAVGR
ncbi:MAG: hypothetical protein GXP47_13275 [Acidobacteria bacterium]|nr:hypothetical protein [Acidobacteriota bacterium]